MTQDQDKIREGRRALFTGAGVTISRESSIPVSDIEHAVQQISTMNDQAPENLPPSLEPVVTRLLSLLQKIEEQKQEFADLESRLFLKSEQISDLQTENIQLSSERETYLNDLITSHTEFDRALEIFQYHEVPMVLTGPGRTVHDANDTFCTLFSITRSDITTIHPPLVTYFPDEPGIDGPDGDHYAVVSLTPPIVPFDHEASSLVILIKTALLPIKERPLDSELNLELRDEPDSPEIILPDEASYAFEQLPIPALVLDEYHTIISCNNAFCSLLGRTKESVRLRDIGSCGLRYEDAICISAILEDAVPRQCEAVVTLPNGSEEPLYLDVSLLDHPSGKRLALIVGVATGGGDLSIPVPEPSEDLMLRMLLDLNPSAVALLDPLARIITANEGFSELTGLSSGDLVGTDVRDLGVALPDEVLSDEFSGVTYLPGIIKIESAWGMQELSGLVASLGNSSGQTVAILILQLITAQTKTPEVISPSAPPESIINPVIASVPLEKNWYDDWDSMPVPGLQSDIMGTVIRVNAAFVNLTETGSELLIGKNKTEILVYDEEGKVHFSSSSGTLTFREYPGQQDPDGLLQNFWYQNLTVEMNNIATLEKRIITLEGEVTSIREEAGSAVSSFSSNDLAEQIDIVEFELHEERYAMDIRMVREVVEMQQITPLPRTPPYVIGIINLRGEVTHVIDLAILLGQRPRTDRSGQKIIIIPSDVTNGEHVAIIVDNVQSVTEIMGRNVSLLGDDITCQINTHIKGIIKISRDDILEKHSEGKGQNATLIIWLDIQKILHDIQGTS